jgi:hypothetical protein
VDVVVDVRLCDIQVAVVVVVKPEQTPLRSLLHIDTRGSLLPLARFILTLCE